MLVRLPLWKSTWGCLGGTSKSSNSEQATSHELMTYTRCNRSEPTTREIESAERALQKVRDDLQSRREEARRASDSPVCHFSVYRWRFLFLTVIADYQQLDEPSGAQIHWWRRLYVVSPSPPSSHSQHGYTPVTLEIKGMEALEYEMSQNLDDLRRRHERAKFASTFRGRLLGVFGKIFAAYCVVRIISVRISVVRISGFGTELFPVCSH